MVQETVFVAKSALFRSRLPEGPPTTGRRSGAEARAGGEGGNGMRIRLSDPAAARDLSEFLRSRIGAIVEQREQGELEVSLVGSYGDRAMQERIELAVGQWSFVRQQPDPLVEPD